MAGAVLPPWLQQLLTEHRASNGPTYGGYLSDHLPMAALAMWHFGVDQQRIRQWSRRYAEQLDTRPSARYLALCSQFDSAIEQQGPAATLQQYLPGLLSGWVKDAFHPLIRLAYGRRYHCHSEISAGLAYLTLVGTDPTLTAYAATAKTRDQIEWPMALPQDDKTFSARVSVFLADPKVTPSLLGPATRQAYAHEALSVMQRTQHFFALHLLTAADAFQVATADLQGISDTLLAAGLLAGYAAAGPLTEVAPDQARRAFRTDAEHDYKVALACSHWAELTASEAFNRASHIFSEQLGNEPYFSTI